MNAFIFLLTHYRPNYSFFNQLGKVITLNNNVWIDWKAKLDSDR